eukprot:gene5236-3750_t
MANCSSYEDKQKIIEDSLNDIFSNKKLNYSFQVITLLESQLSGQCRRLLRHRFDQILADQVRALRQYFLTLHIDRDESLDLFVCGWEEFNHQVSTCCFLFPDCTQDYFQTANILFQQDICADKRLQQKVSHWVSTAVLKEKWSPLLTRYATLLLPILDRRNVEPLLQSPCKESISKRYSSDAQDKVEELKVPEFIKWVQEIQELWNCSLRQSGAAETKAFPTVRESIHRALSEVLVLPHIEYLFNSPSGCLHMTRSWEFRNIALFQLFYGSMVGDHQVEELFKRVLQEKMDRILCIMDSNPAAGVRMTLDVLANASKLYELIFKKFPEKEYLSELNQKGFAEAVSIFYDRCVKTMEISDTVIENISKLFNLVEDEDALDRAVKKSMSVRLVNAEQNHLQMERRFLAAIPSKRVSSFECMIDDVERGWEISSKFKWYQDEQGSPLPITFRATVLRGGSLLPLVGVAPPLPQSMMECEACFMNLYAMLHSGRRLVFLKNLGNVQLDLHHNGTTYFVTAPTPFSTTLLAFNENKWLSIPELSTQTGADATAVQRHIKKLLECRLIVEREKTYRFNNDFSCSKTHVIIDGPLNSRGDGDGASPAVDPQRGALAGVFLDAAIVKEVKQSSPLSHQRLCEKVHQVRGRGFLITHAEVKASLQNLMERGLITRSSLGYTNDKHRAFISALISSFPDGKRISMPAAHRKPFADLIMEMIEEHFGMILAILAGTVSILFFSRRRGGGDAPLARPAGRGSTAGTMPSISGGAPTIEPNSTIVDAFKKGKFNKSKICVTWDVLGDSDVWKDGGEAAAQCLVASTEVFIMCRVKDEGEKKRILSLLRPLAESGLERKRILFCTTAKGYEAFTRQVNPNLLITHDLAQARFLARVLHYILFVGNDTIDEKNVQTVSSVAVIVQINPSFRMTHATNK